MALATHIHPLKATSTFKESPTKTATVKPNWSNPVHLLAFGFGSGAAPKAPGTYGTIAAVLLYWPLSKLSLDHYLLMTLVTGVVGIYLCGKTAKGLGIYDHGGIFWDQFVGFVLFRFFDIPKPWPMNWIDKKVAGGIGIMLDDVIAGPSVVVLNQQYFCTNHS